MKTLIGLTGLSGSGKSAAGRVLRNLGACVIDCDAIAHNALEQEDIAAKLRGIFGDKIIKNGKVDRQILGETVFSSKKNLDLLNKTVHPWINSRILELAQSAAEDIVVIDGSELEASGIDLCCRHIIVVEAREDIRIERIISRDNITRENALKRIRAQKPYSKKASVVTNNEGISDLELKLKRLFADMG